VLITLVYAGGYVVESIKQKIINSNGFHDVTVEQKKMPDGTDGVFATAKRNGPDGRELTVVCGVSVRDYSSELLGEIVLDSLRKECDEKLS
jgi:hypothetical protein